MRKWGIAFAGWVVAPVIAVGVLGTMSADAATNTTVPIITSACFRESTLEIHYSVAQGGRRFNWITDKGYVQTVLKAPTDGTDRYFVVPSSSGGENVRRVAGTYAMTGINRWRVQYKYGSTVEESPIAVAQGACS
jgi:hypothetical protein